MKETDYNPQWWRVLWHKFKVWRYSEKWSRKCKCKYPRVFRVTNEDGSKFGDCYSWYDHFDVAWDDGDFLKTNELSLHGIRKVKK